MSNIASFSSSYCNYGQSWKQYAFETCSGSFTLGCNMMHHEEWYWCQFASCTFGKFIKKSDCVHAMHVLPFRHLVSNDWVTSNAYYVNVRYFHNVDYHIAIKSLQYNSTSGQELLAHDTWVMRIKWCIANNIQTGLAYFCTVGNWFLWLMLPRSAHYQIACTLNWCLSETPWKNCDQFQYQLVLALLVAFCLLPALTAFGYMHALNYHEIFLHASPFFEWFHDNLTPCINCPLASNSTVTVKTFM